jgi:hypothetical protein
MPASATSFVSVNSRMSGLPLAKWAASFEKRARCATSSFGVRGSAEFMPVAWGW